MRAVISIVEVGFMYKVIFCFLIFFSFNANSIERWVILEGDSYYLWPGAYANDLIRIQLKAGVANDPDECAVENASNYYLDPSLSKDVIARSYSLLLAAKMSGKPVNAYINGCESGMPSIQSLQFL